MIPIFISALLQRDNSSLSRMQAYVECGLRGSGGNKEREAGADAEVCAMRVTARDGDVVFANVAGVRIEDEEIAVAAFVFAQDEFKPVFGAGGGSHADGSV